MPAAEEGREAEGAPGPGGALGINASGVVYGIVAVATVIAAEATRRETYPKVVAASAVTMALYWLAHAYARHLGLRFERGHGRRLGHLPAVLTHEAAILAGAAVPLGALLLSWLAGAPLETGVTAALWSAGGELVVLELVTGLRRHLPLVDMAIETCVGIAMGLAILGIRLLLH